MDQITLKNFRCFRDEQTARMAPLTLLVGENSTGKTSFLAMVRALWDVAYNLRIPDFKEEPYDLGGFDEIAHYRGARGGRADTFEAGFDAKFSIPLSQEVANGIHRLKVTFGEQGTTAVPVERLLSLDDIWIDERFETGWLDTVHFGNVRGIWKRRIPGHIRAHFRHDDYLIEPFIHPFEISHPSDGDKEYPEFTPLCGSPVFSSEDMDSLTKLGYFASMLFNRRPFKPRPFASAPVRSKPHRTYDPARPTPDPEGDYVPMYLASVYFQNKEDWAELQKRLNDFGKAAGLFDEISVKQLGRRSSEPFQVQIRKYGGGLKGPQRNLIDVGYGVSQVLPVITEMFREDAPEIFLLQQPEVHLHPSAQAALGSLFCEVASRGRRLVVETHSDYLIDRVRMDVRDGVSALKPDDVSILFFERDGLEVKIHSLSIDEEGNIQEAPDSYGRFFLQETTRSIQKRRKSAVG